MGCFGRAFGQLIQPGEAPRRSEAFERRSRSREDVREAAKLLADFADVAAESGQDRGAVVDAAAELIEPGLSAARAFGKLGQRRAASRRQVGELRLDGIRARK